MKGNELLKVILETWSDAEFLIADGLDDAVIGVDTHAMRLIYSVKKSIEILANNMDITIEDLEEEELLSGITVDDKKYEMANEYFYYNTWGAYLGDKTPIWCEDNLN